MTDSGLTRQDFAGGERSPSTLVELLRARAEAWPSRRIFTFLADGERESDRLTYAELDEGARAVGAMLQRSGMSGGRALLLYPFGLEFITAFFGCLYGGVVAIPATPPNPARPQRTLSRLRAMAEDAGATLGLTTSEMMPLVEEMCGQTEGLRGVRWVATDAPGRDFAGRWEEPAIDGQTLAYLQYTSGSTTAPKGAMVSHRNVLHNSGYIARAWGYTRESVSVVWVPYYHDDGLVHGIVQPVYRGGAAFLMSPQAFIQQPARWLRAVTRHRATHTGGPNFAYDLCVNKVTPEQRAGLDLSCWRMAYNAAEPVRPQTLARFAATFGPYGFGPEAFHPSYGLAEATLLVTTKQHAGEPALCAVRADALERDQRIVEAAPGDPRARTFVSCGEPVGETKVVIARPDALTPCADGEVGEILISDAGVVQGYWQRPEENARTFGVRLSGDGEGSYLRTGDLGFMRGGELYVAGRIKDLIIIRGQNYYPQDIEWTVERSHTVLRPGCCAAFSLDVEGEERLVVAVEAGPRCESVRYAAGGSHGLTCAGGLPFDAEEAISAIRQAVAEHHELQPYAVLLLEAGSIPKTSSGKIQRHACREAFLTGAFNVAAAWAQNLRDAATSDEAVAPSDADDEGRGAPHSPQVVRAWLVEQLTRRLGLTTPKLDGPAPDFELSFSRLGLDSIAAFELKNSIETRWGVAVPVTKLLEDTTIAQLAGWVCEHVAEAAPAPVATGALDLTAMGATATDAPLPALSGVIPPHELDGLLSNLDQLSETQLDRVLNQLLAEGGGES